MHRICTLWEKTTKRIISQSRDDDENKKKIVMSSHENNAMKLKYYHDLSNKFYTNKVIRNVVIFD